MPGPSVIMVIRHGEKPAEFGPGPSPAGIDGQGNLNPHSLTPAGWDRARALAALLAAPALRAPFARPTHLFAPAYDKAEAEHRPYQTLMPTATSLGLQIQTPVPEGAEAELAHLVAGLPGAVVLVCWEHHRIPGIVGPLAQSLGVAAVPPNGQEWPDDDFSSVLVFRATPAGCELLQTSEALLPGDPVA
jgi:hypothetical protein